jgi:hypothetical protein
MRIIAKESYIKSRVRVGERAPLVGLILLLVATILIWTRPEWWLLTMTLVWAGFITSMIGGYLGERFVGPLAHHKKVPEALKGLGGDYTLLMYELSSPFVLVESSGLTVILVKSQGGEITYEDGKWRHRQKLRFFRRFAGQEGIGRPDQQAQFERKQVKKALKKLTPDTLDIPVRALILFVDPDVQLDAEDSPVPAIRAAKLKSWLRGEGRAVNLPEETQKQLHQALGINEA